MVETDSENDIISNPSHYDQASAIVKIQPIDMIRSLTFEIGSAFKYLYRYQYKGKPAEDLRKARQYLYWAIESERPFTNTLNVSDIQIIKMLNRSCKDEMLKELFKIFRINGSFNRYGAICSEQLNTLNKVVSMINVKIDEYDNAVA
jgi:hypothetical protein